ncbi:RICIN domain-containing protein [Streptomyces sp. NPDC003077]|uniref:RICIN domain-containing protein n=1 Tax=Streptomyces sp. NPDC003077 TaxID=3154443 RepID=UPI0033BD792D
MRRLVSIMAAVGALAAISAPAMAEESGAGELPAGRIVMIKNVQRGTCVLDEGGDGRPDNLVLRPCDSSNPSQKFHQIPVGTHWNFKNLGTGLCMDNNNWEAYSKYCNGGAAQRWEGREIVENVMMLKTQYSTRCLDSNGSVLFMRECMNQPWQRWEIISV